MESLLTNIHSIEKIPYTDDLDTYLVVIDDPHIHRMCGLPTGSSPPQEIQPL